MHSILKHIKKIFGTTILSFIMMFSGSLANAELSVEDIIKSRKALFSKNYSTAKRVQSFSSNGDFDEAIELMKEMNENYITLLDLFPENSKEGFKTEALPIIWEEKDAFNELMQKSADDMIKLTSIIEDADDIKGTLGKLMWANCKACHSKYRVPQ
ncbi:cytochrome c [Candidatus Pelagibacter sp.]|uniref:cytochrome c n=1 Tax=Candidatus Pelagibacter sp. TaxID=2024849 RepID=UPI003D128AE5